ncbi:uncharacterized protein LOC130743695 [Lotus japonicus]|uniref:uncharacterized protein LOC130743695 n=1 Tax=Lotus japonicus TaxID=34305 RepID=UPI00258263A8|nr:uncharacterized protein LOC130743695 [Lotus japonicus]
MMESVNVTVDDEPSKKDDTNMDEDDDGADTPTSLSPHTLITSDFTLILSLSIHNNSTSTLTLDCTKSRTAAWEQRATTTPAATPPLSSRASGSAALQAYAQTEIAHIDFLRSTVILDVWGIFHCYMLLLLGVYCVMLAALYFPLCCLVVYRKPGLCFGLLVADCNGTCCCGLVLSLQPLMVVKIMATTHSWELMLRDEPLPDDDYTSDEEEEDKEEGAKDMVGL